MAEDSNAPENRDKYWETWTGIAPIKAEYVLWNKMGKGRAGGGGGGAIDDDAAEGRSTELHPLRSADVAAVPPQTAVPDDQAESAVPLREPELQRAGQEAVSSAPGLESQDAGDAAGGAAEPEPKKVRLSGAQKKAAAKARQQEQWEAKKAAKDAAQREATENGTRVKLKGQNKNRKFDHNAGTGEFRICNILAQGKPCERTVCKLDHDLAGFMKTRQADIQLALPTTPDDLTPTPTAHTCPLFLSIGRCPYGFKCRYGESHIKKVDEGQGFNGCGYELVENEAVIKKIEAESGQGLAKLSHMAEKNFVSTMTIKSIRGGGKSEEKFPISCAYLTSIGEPFDAREDGGKGKGRGNKRDRNGEKKPEPVPAAAPASASTTTTTTEGSASTLAGDVSVEPVASTSAPAAKEPEDVDAHPSRSFVPDLAPVRASEKRRLDFRGKLYMAPLTTVGNLPFRRLCVENGLDITCSEMGLAQEFLTGNANEWSLVRRHPSEKLFGVQITGSKPQVLVPAAEAIVKNANIDFLDVNCGCPIDLVFNKGAGSALLAHATKLGKSLIGMGKALGEIPLTIKIRTGVTNSNPVAHKLMPRLQSEWGIQGVTMHGRSRQQRYKSVADYKYIGECVKVLREHAADEGLEPIPIFGNGDAYDYRTYYENMESSGVDGIMIARGALIKPWIFSEIKERRDWDISSRERLDMVGKLCDYGLEHWGSDQIGVNKTRRFVCESLSFTHRYVPVGLLERMPAHMNERALPFKGRDELETLLASDQANDWVKITNMFLGQPPDDWSFTPKHKAASADPEAQG
ncbi:hypothetical protein JCM11491_002806 [Sporobolomyces phaffii]